MQDTLILLTAFVASTALWLLMQLAAHYPSVKSTAHFQKVRGMIHAALIVGPLFVFFVLLIRACIMSDFDSWLILGPMFVAWAFFISLVALKLVMHWKNLPLTAPPQSPPPPASPPEP